MNWLDRLAPNPLASPSAAEVEAAPWRYVLDLGCGAVELLANGRRLVSDPRGVSLCLGDQELSLRWYQDAIRHDQKVRLERSRELRFPQDIELRRLQMAREFARSTGDEVLFPLETPLDEREDYQELIALIERNAAPIAGICNRPRLGLRVEETAEVLRRARRMTLRTAPYLARHAEDWEGHSLRMPHPRRLLTAVPEDEWSTYENRLVRTVVRDAYAELRHRQRELQSTLRQMDEALKVSRLNAQQGHWSRVHRIYQLLRGNIAVDILSKECERLERQAQRLLRAAGIMGAARSSPLFRHLGAIRDERQLHSTNLLLHDSAYHSALLVRQKLNRLRQQRGTLPLQDPLPYYFEWVEHALRRALAQTGFEQSSAQRFVGRDWSVEISTILPARRIELRFTRIGRESDNGKPATAGATPLRGFRKPSPASACPHSQRLPLHILPVWLDLSDDKLRTLVLKESISAASGARLLLVYPGDADAGTSEERANEDFYTHQAAVASPGRLDSIEMLSRELVRETWLRDLLDRRWPRWCLVCMASRLEHGNANSFRCDTCGTEAGITQKTCACGQQFSVPYLRRKSEHADAGLISRGNVLESSAVLTCKSCRHQ